MKYTVTLLNKFKRPYIYGKLDTTCINTDYVSYETEDLNMLKEIIKDLLDIPISELSLDEIKKQFSSPSYANISEEKLISIQNYYNGRFALYKTIMNDIDDNIYIHHKYNIPYEYNHFVVEDDDKFNEEQIEAFIEIALEMNIDK